MAAQQCPQCGQANAADSANCSYCGHALAGEGAPSRPDPAATTPSLQPGSQYPPVSEQRAGGALFRSPGESGSGPGLPDAPAWDMPSRDRGGSQRVTPPPPQTRSGGFATPASAESPRVGLSAPPESNDDVEIPTNLGLSAVAPPTAQSPGSADPWGHVESRPVDPRRREVLGLDRPTGDQPRGVVNQLYSNDDYVEQVDAGQFLEDDALPPLNLPELETPPEAPRPKGPGLPIFKILGVLLLLALVVGGLGALQGSGVIADRSALQEVLEDSVTAAGPVPAARSKLDQVIGRRQLGAHATQIYSVIEGESNRFRIGVDVSDTILGMDASYEVSRIGRFNVKSKLPTLESFTSKGWELDDKAQSMLDEYKASRGK